MVVIYAAEIPCPEDVRQMVARGNRALGAYTGYVFCEGKPEKSIALSNKYLENVGPDYKDAALLLGVL